MVPEKRETKPFIAHFGQIGCRGSTVLLASATPLPYRGYPRGQLTTDGGAHRFSYADPCSIEQPSIQSTRPNDKEAHMIYERLVSASIALIVSTLNSTAAAQSSTVDKPGDAKAMTAPKTLVPHQQAVWVRAQVLDVNMPERVVALRTTEGDLELQVLDTVKRLEDVHVGDWLDVRYELALAISAVQVGTGIRSRTTEQGMNRQMQGSPAGAGYIAETLVVDVLNVNKPSGAIHIRGPKRTEWVRVLDAALIDSVKAGVQIEIKYKLAVAIEFQAAPQNNK